MPSALEQRLFKAKILFAYEYFGLAVQAKPLSVHGPLHCIFNIVAAGLRKMVNGLLGARLHLRVFEALAHEALGGLAGGS